MRCRRRHRLDTGIIVISSFLSDQNKELSFVIDDDSVIGERERDREIIDSRPLLLFVIYVNHGRRGRRHQNVSSVE